MLVTDKYVPKFTFVNYERKFGARNLIVAKI